jgi:hypothetical protein
MMSTDRAGDGSNTGGPTKVEHAYQEALENAYDIASGIESEVERRLEDIEFFTDDTFDPEIFLSHMMRIGKYDKVLLL